MTRCERIRKRSKIEHSSQLKEKVVPLQSVKKLSKVKPVRISKKTSIKQRYRLAERLQGFVPEPTVETMENGEKLYRYQGVEVKLINSKKGLGVVATKPLARGFLIPYGGKRSPDTDLIRYWRKKPHRIPADRTIAYVIESYSSIKTKKSDCYIDANPSTYPKKCPKYAWIGSLVNAADSFEDVNCKLILRHDWTNSKSGYQYPHSRNKHFIETTRVINPGEELVTNYRYGAKIEGKKGFGPTQNKKGKRTTTSKKQWDVLRQLRREMAATHLNDPNNMAKRHPKRLKVKRSKITPW